MVSKCMHWYYESFIYARNNITYPTDCSKLDIIYVQYPKFNMDLPGCFLFDGYPEAISVTGSFLISFRIGHPPMGYILWGC